MRNVRFMGLTYDDVQLIPQFSEIASRLDVSITTKLHSRSGHNIVLNVPIMSAAMDTITDAEMAIAMARNGGIGIIHRFQTVDSQLEQLRKVDGGVGASIGLDTSLDDCLRLAECAGVLNVDIAHADNSRVVDFVSKLREKTERILMVGNIATGTAAIRLMRAGADVLKVGIGGGSICSTRMVTGFGVPNITAIMDVSEEVEREMERFGPSMFKNSGRVTIVADGGIRYSCDIAKAIAAGADAVMLGSMISGTDETPGKLIMCPDGYMGKKYRGMASKDAQDAWKGLKKGTAAEGISTYVRSKGSVVPIIKELAGGLRSALTYAGACNLTEFYENTEFVQVTQAGIKEASTHILGR